MPLYEYECLAPGHHRFERIQKYTDPLPEACPVCGSAVRKLASSPAIQFKGSGFYITDYAKKSSNEAGKGAKSDGAKGEGSKSEGSGGDGSKSEGSSSESKSEGSKSESSKSEGSKSESSGSKSDGASASSSPATKSEPKAEPKKA